MNEPLRGAGPAARLGYIHALRGVAILLIVGAHTNSFSPSGFSWIEAIYRAFLREGTALFVLISGFLFQHLHARYTAGSYWRSKARNVVLPYIVMSVPAIALNLGVMHDTALHDFPALRGHSLIYQIGYFLLTGASLLPLWFIPVLILIMACYPLLRFLAESPSLAWVGPLCLVSLLFTERSLHNMNPLIGFIHFMPVYVIGMWLYRYWDVWIGRAAQYWGLLLALFSGMWLLETVFRDPFTYSSVAIFAKLLVFILFCALCFEMDFDRLSARIPVIRGLNYLASLSFAIYFIHGYVAAMVARSPLATPVENPLVSILLGIVNALLVTAVSVLITEVARLCLSSRSRMIVGA